MNNKIVITTAVAIVAVVAAVGLLSFYVARNQPTADVEVPPTPPLPGGAPEIPPFVPDIPRLSGDVLDDGRVDSLDINVLVLNWKKQNPEYNLLDGSSDTPGILNALDLAQTIKYWKCLEGKQGCLYLK